MTGATTSLQAPAVSDVRSPLRGLMITTEWPTPEMPYAVPFIVRQVDFLRRAGVEIEVFSFRGARNPLNYLRAWWRVQRKLWGGAYDVIHAQWGQSAPTALPTRLPLVVTFRGGEGEGIVANQGRRQGRYTFSGFVLRMVSAFVTRRADELVVVSSRMQESLPKRDMHVIPSGLDFSRLPLLPAEEARRQLGLPLAKHLVLFVGNPAEARKRYDLAREVVARIDRRLDAELVVAWQVPHERVPIYMNACDALLFVSMYEGSPNVVKEALACNLPVVSVEVGDVAERLSGVAGCRLCRSADPDELARALEEVLRSNQRIEGRAAVLDLDENVLARKMAHVYRLAVDRRRTAVRHRARDQFGNARPDTRL